MIKVYLDRSEKKKKGPLISDLWLSYFSIKCTSMVLVSINKGGKTSVLAKGIMDLCELQPFCTWFLPFSSPIFFCARPITKFLVASFIFTIYTRFLVLEYF